uniref:Uncharacterized protein n=1 Tax=Timema shepardi TaxID=629360 RepID=A0A7R9B4Q5_TIMSH|nr:unnamed protein product [Timema shepardi]
MTQDGGCLFTSQQLSGKRALNRWILTHEIVELTKTEPQNEDEFDTSGQSGIKTEDSNKAEDFKDIINYEAQRFEILDVERKSLLDGFLPIKEEIKDESDTTNFVDEFVKTEIKLFDTSFGIMDSKIEHLTPVDRSERGKQGRKEGKGECTVPEHTCTRRDFKSCATRPAVNFTALSLARGGESDASIFIVVMTNLQSFLQCRDTVNGYMACWEAAPYIVVNLIRMGESSLACRCSLRRCSCAYLLFNRSSYDSMPERRSAVARLRTSDLTVMPNQVVCERADLLFKYRVIVMTLNLANELINLMKWNR